MTKFLSSLVVVGLMLGNSYASAEEAAAPTPESIVQPVVEQTAAVVTDTVGAVAEAPAAIVETPSEVVVPALDALPVPDLAETPQVVAEAIPTDNLEFISGEISTIDETTQAVVVKLYGETESGTSDKTLKVTVDSTTDITDGEQDRDLKSLTTGTEVDVEYDPATNKATYIFVY